MAELVVEGDELVVRLGRWEVVGAMRGDVRVPLSAVRRVRVVADASKERRGIRAPGTGWPGRIALGTWKGSFGKDFAAVYGHGRGIVVDLDGAEFQRLIVSVDHPDAVAATIPIGGPTSG